MKLGSDRAFLPMFNVWLSSFFWGAASFFADSCDAVSIASTCLQASDELDSKFQTHSTELLCDIDF